MTSEGGDSGQPAGTNPAAPEFTHFTEPAPPEPERASSDSDWSTPTFTQHQAGDEPADVGGAVPPPGQLAFEKLPVESLPVESLPVESLPFENAVPPQHATELTPPRHATELVAPQHFDEPDAAPQDLLPPDLIPYQPEHLTQPEPEHVTQPEPDPEPEPVPVPEQPAPRVLRPPPPPQAMSSPPIAFAPRRARITYERGSVGTGHEELVERAADVAVAAMPIPLRVLDVGCGDGQLLAELIVRVPYAELYVGVDPIPDVMPAPRLDSDPRLCLVRAAAESLPFADASFDLVLATLSFSYWKDQRKGMSELGRVVAGNGKVVVVEPAGGDAKGKGRLHGEKDIAYALNRAGLELERTETVGRSRMGRVHARAFIATR